MCAEPKPVRERRDLRCGVHFVYCGVEFLEQFGLFGGERFLEFFAVISHEVKKDLISNPQFLQLIFHSFS